MKRNINLKEDTLNINLNPNIPEIGLKDGETRATFILQKELVEKIKNYSWLKQQSIKETLNSILFKFFEKNKFEDILNKAKQIKKEMEEL